MLRRGELTLIRQPGRGDHQSGPVEAGAAGLPAPGAVGPPTASTPTTAAEALAELRARLATWERRYAAIESELARARLVQQQLESYAHDFRRIYAESRRRLHYITTLYEVSSAIVATVDPSEVMARAVGGLRRLLPATSAAIYLLENDGRLARRMAFSGPWGGAQPPEMMVGADGVLGRALSDGRMVLDGPAEPGPRGGAPRWSLALPLSVGSRRLGALLLVREVDRPFSAEDRHLAEPVAAQTALALDHARLITTDPLTGLYNRRHFEQALAIECERARRAARPVGLLMVDVDRFKRFNARFGHPAGDEVLRQVAATLAGQLRRADILARVGGEEFAVLLPEADAAAVETTAERLRAAIANGPPPRFEGRELPDVRISLGGVSIADETVSPARLMRAADGALRKAKRTGRNRGVIAHPGGPRVAAMGNRAAKSEG